jgi:hypothetical protein
MVDRLIGNRALDNPDPESRLPSFSSLGHLITQSHSIRRQDHGGLAWMPPESTPPGKHSERQAPEIKGFYDAPFFREVLRNGTVGACLKLFLNPFPFDSSPGG